MDDVLKAMREGGFKPQANVDEDFPALKGEYRVDVKGLKPWIDKKTGSQDAYMLELRVTETLDGDKGDGRTFSRFYRTGGEIREYGKGSRAIEQRDVIESLKKMCNDVYTLDGAPQLDTSSTAALEACFPEIIGKIGYIRAWHFKPEDSDKAVQQWILKTEKDLRKAGRDGAVKDKPAPW